MTCRGKGYTDGNETYDSFYGYKWGKYGMYNVNCTGAGRVGYICIYLGTSRFSSPLFLRYFRLGLVRINSATKG